MGGNSRLGAAAAAGAPPGAPIPISGPPGMAMSGPPGPPGPPGMPGSGPGPGMAAASAPGVGSGPIPS
ncbi:MAG TPA: hypothetical protein DGT21_18900 [Armatimonadetes bacterium]|nr:hypothetical protein [Armatimonadota bacterium]